MGTPLTILFARCAAIGDGNFFAGNFTIDRHRLKIKFMQLIIGNWERGHPVRSGRDARCSKHAVVELFDEFNAPDPNLRPLPTQPPMAL